MDPLDTIVVGSPGTFGEWIGSPIHPRMSRLGRPCGRRWQLDWRLRRRHRSGPKWWCRTKPNWIVAIFYPEKSLLCIKRDASLTLCFGDRDAQFRLIDVGGRLWR